ncbi:MAG: MarR family transcriptional regulator [Xanthomonadaceae bacterium]|nr:MarR family transcriptional regulator [Xanthomonadaceae bacterium]
MMIPPASPDQTPSLGLLLKQTHEGLRQQVEGRFISDGVDLSFSQFLLLKTLMLSGPCSAMEIALAIDQTPSTVTRLLDKLEHGGYLRREADEQDRRALQIVPTGTGREKCTQAWAVIDEVAEAVQEYVGRAEWERFIATLTRIRDYFQ